MSKIAEMTDNGLVVATENEIFQMLLDKQLDIDPDFNTDPSTSDMQNIAWWAEKLREDNEALVNAYNSKDPNKARGTMLDIIGLLTGFTREDGTATVINIEVSSTVTVTEGSTISDGTYEYTIDSDIDVSGGTGTGTATCTTIGSDVNPSAGTVTDIVDTIGGWSAVTNTSIETQGTNKQSNAQARAERKRTVARAGSNIVDATISEIFAVDDVLRVAGYENPTGSADVSEDNPYGLPANSVAYVVYGGDDTAVAQAIYNKKNPGRAQPQPGTPVNVYVTSPKHKSNNQWIRYSRPILVDAVTVIELKDPLGNLPVNYEELIQDAIIDYVNGELIDEDEGFDNEGFDIGEDVPVRRIDTPINYIIGQYKGAYIYSSTINGTSSVIDIDFKSIINFTKNNISVSVVV